MSGETLEDYFRRLNLDETRRKYLENIKEGKQVDMAVQEQQPINKENLCFIPTHITGKFQAKYERMLCILVQEIAM